MKNTPIAVFLLLAAARLAFSPSSAGEPAGAVLKQTTLRGVKNQCMNGMWGHAPALANGHSEGYGGMNMIGLPMTISLVLARQAGVSDPALDKAIDKSATLLRYYVDKGAIPYGDLFAISLRQYDDSVVRASIIPVLNRLSDRELALLLPDIIRAIAQIEASTDEPTLISLKDYIANAKKNNPETESSNQ